ncbi:hypothetical protein LCL98_03335 [Rossellomorea aquimaris]|nr:hypothetical protein [Rossellomorea aquimaris]
MRQLSPIQLQQQIIHYKSELEKYKRKCETLEDEYLAKKYTALKKENRQLQSYIDTRNQELTSKETEMKQETLKYHLLLSSQEKEMKKLRSSFNQLKEQLQKHTLQVRHSTKQNEYLLQRKEAQQGEILSLQEENSYLRDENDCLWRRIKMSEKQLYREEIDSWQLEELLKDFKEKLDYRTQCFEMDITFADDEKNRLKDINQLLETQLYLTEIELYETHKLQKEYDLYYKNIIHFQKQKLSEADQRQKKKESFLQLKEKEIKELQQDKTEYITALKSVRESIRQMKGEVVAIDKEPPSAKDTLTKYENSIHHLQYTNALLLQEINKIKNKPGP